VSKTRFHAQLLLAMVTRHRHKLLRLRVLVHFDNPIQTPPLTCIKVIGGGGGDAAAAADDDDDAHDDATTTGRSLLHATMVQKNPKSKQQQVRSVILSQPVTPHGNSCHNMIVPTCCMQLKPRAFLGWCLLTVQQVLGFEFYTLCDSSSSAEAGHI
jgi:hypothetical protein